MGNWKRKKLKKERNFGKGQTAGSTKGANCQAGPEARFIAKRSRSWKYSRYHEWCAFFTGNKPHRLFG